MARRTACAARLPAALLIGALLVAGCGPAITITVGQPVPSPTAAVAPAGRTDAAPRERPASEPADGGSGSVASGSVPVSLGALRTPPPTALHVPALGLTAPVEPVASAIVDGEWGWPVPEHAAAHHLGTANPGEPGNIVLSGHVVTREGPGVFAPLLQAAPGQEITLDSAAGSFAYRVASVTVVPETDTSAMRQTASEQLTLITCIPDGRFEHRLVVVAFPVTTATARIP
ncbi:MAG: sortase [Sphaerobacter sp.]|nr:sortase [Sphaerobacter sp.]